MASIPPVRPSQGPSLGWIASLPREIILSIFSHVATPGHEAPSHLAPFLTCGQEWFDLAFPFVWRFACVKAITHPNINPARRAAYASHIEAFLDADSCRCRRCMQPPRNQEYGGHGDIVQPSRADVEIMQTIRAFPKLHTLDLGRTHVASVVDLTQHIGGLAENLTRLRVRSWGNGFEAPRSLIDLVSRLSKLDHLEVHEIGEGHEEPVPDRRRPYWPNLTSAQLFCYQRWEFPTDVHYQDFPPADTCAALLDALSGAPNLRRLRVFVPVDMPGSLVRPEPPWDPPSRPRRRPFPKLEELMVAIEGHQALRHLPELRTLTKLAVSFDASAVDRRIMGVFARMPHLKQLIITANQESTFRHSWVSTGFTVADFAAAVRPMSKLRSLTLNFPTQNLHINHAEAAHRLLLLIATNNQRLKILHLGFRVPFPLSAWDDLLPLTIAKSSLQVLTIESCKPHSQLSETVDVTPQYVAEGIRRLRLLFPNLRTFISKKDGISINFSC